MGSAALIAAICTGLFASVVGVVALRSERERVSTSVARVPGPGAVHRQPGASLATRFGLRSIDLVLGLLGLLVLAPVFAVVAIVVKLDSPGPTLFRQHRIGANGKTISVAKFRTMRPEEEDVLAAGLGRDPRISRVGQFLRRMGLDELPQLVSVVRGDMSLVGPRPHLEVFLEIIPAELRDVVIRVRPGIVSPAPLGLTFAAALAWEAEYATRPSISQSLGTIGRAFMHSFRREVPTLRFDDLEPRVHRPHDLEELRERTYSAA